MNNKVWLLYMIGTEKSNLSKGLDELTPVLVGVYSDLEALQSDNELLRSEVAEGGFIQAQLNGAVDMGEIYCLALGAIQVATNCSIEEPDSWRAAMIVCTCYCLYLLRLEQGE